jgi:hypothetical protein
MSRWKLVFLSLFAVVAMSAVAAASASALEFYVEGALIATLLPVLALGELQTLKGETGGAKIEIGCKHLDGSGSIHNGLGSGSMLMGLGLLSLSYLSCNINSPKPNSVKGCQIPGGTIHTAVKLLTITLGGESAIEFTPDEGGTFVDVEFINCQNTGLNGEHIVSGLARGMVNNSKHEINTMTGKEELIFGGNEATYEGSATMTMEGGGLILVE